MLSRPSLIGGEAPANHAQLAWLGIGEVDRSPRAKNLASCAGLVPHSIASGGSIRHGDICRNVNQYPRWKFVEAATCAMQIKSSRTVVLVICSRLTSARLNEGKVLEADLLWTSLRLSDVQVGPRGYYGRSFRLAAREADKFRSGIRTILTTSSLFAKDQSAASANKNVLYSTGRESTKGSAVTSGSPGFAI